MRSSSKVRAYRIYHSEQSMHYSEEFLTVLSGYTAALECRSTRSSLSVYAGCVDLYPCVCGSTHGATGSRDVTNTFLYFFQRERELEHNVLVCECGHMPRPHAWPPGSSAARC